MTDPDAIAEDIVEEAVADPLRSLVNSRDLGGLPLTTGGTTRAGMLIRSDAPYLDDLDPAGLAVWPPRTVVDLRDENESGTGLAQWPPSVSRVSAPLFSGARMDRDVYSMTVPELYTSALSAVPDRVANALNHFDVDGPTLVHCAAGKDRTGIVVATALSLAGVEPEAIIADYVATELAIEMIVARLRSRGRLSDSVSPDNPLLRAPREGIEIVLDAVHGGPDGPWGWFESHGGDVQRFEGWVRAFR